MCQSQGSSHVDTSPASSRNSLWAAEAGRVRRRSSIVVRPAMQLLRLMPILMMSLLWQAWSQEDDDVDDVDDVEFEELEDGPENDGTFEPEETHKRFDDHPLWQDCVKHAEAVEGEHGLYDNAEAGHEGRQKLAAALKEKTLELVKTPSSTFEEKFVEKLQDVQAKRRGFGAPDACDFLLQHHEL
ncbi:unnamed protein product [Durusdinium trenchii]|uniref:Uncharacterized protein n=1 Tax=Durusdinium trenchii TaxID=1381693 RepID=A0ABP0P7H9_9DINO